MQRLCLAALGLLALGAEAPAAAECESKPGVESFTQGWGLDARNTRFQADTVIDRGNVEDLRLAWAFALPGGKSPHSYPAVTEDTVFIGTQSGELFALDRETGCTRWNSGVRDAAGGIAPDGIRSGVIMGAVDGQARLFFGTGGGLVHAMDAGGDVVWSFQVEEPNAMITGTPLFHAGRLFVPVSSYELALAMNPLYACCKFRGTILALDAATGELLWRTHTVDEAAQVTGSHWGFVKEWGPSGAPVWSAPTADRERGWVFVGTGENYTAPATDTSDAILALRAQNGSRVWSRQFTENDAFNMGCVISASHPNCPDDAGPDYDFGAPPILAKTPTGKAVLLAGQKSGGVHAMRPDTGAVLWTRQLGRGGYLGGVHWGMAVNEGLGLVYAPMNDTPVGPAAGEWRPGLHALAIETGEERWFVPAGKRCDEREACFPGFSAAVTATPELVFAGALDGHFAAYDAANGNLLWEFDTWREFDAVNGRATGAAIDVHGPMVVGDTVFVQSGYGEHGQAGGNALLAFRLPAGPRDAPDG